MTDEERIGVSNKTCVSDGALKTYEPVLSRARHLDADELGDLQRDCEEIWTTAYAAACEAKRLDTQKMLNARDDRSEAIFRERMAQSAVKAECVRSAKLLKALDFYAKHHHHLKTTSPNFAREAIAEYEANRD